MSNEKENIWYVSASSKAGSFTSDPEQAVKDLTGAPVVAPGHMKGMVRKAAQDRAASMINNLVSQVWERTLDKMEELYSLQEERDGVGIINETSEHEQKRHEVGYRLSELSHVLAILEYNYEYDEDPKAAIERVQREATVRYNESAGDW